jgi:phosphoglucomutase
MHSRAGLRALSEDLIDLDALVRAYFEITPDVSNPAQKVVFGTSGHRGSSLDGGFNENHILAVTQAVVEHRAAQGITGPIFVGRDTHGLSEPAFRSVLEVLAGNGVQALIDSRDGYTPTPSVSHAILTFNRQGGAQADGLLLTPSHNPPRDGGIKYNPPSGGPADSSATSAIAARANALLGENLAGVKRAGFDAALKAAGRYDFLGRYVDDLPSVIDIEAIRAAGVRIGADPLGGAAVAYWGAIAERHRLNLTVVNDAVDPRWAFMPLDTDGKIRMDCSSASAMANLIEIMKGGAYDVATGNDADADRHGIVTPDAGLMNPNHYLAVAISYLFTHRPTWGADVAVGKTLVSSSMIDRVVGGLGRRLLEVPVGFKYFVPRPAGRLGRLRRRGVGRRGLPAARRQRVDHRQGRPAAGPAGRRDPGHDRQERQPALRRSDGEIWRSGLCPGRRPGEPRREGAPGQAQPLRRQRQDPGRRADHRHPHQRPGQWRGDRRPEGDDPERLVRRAAVGHRGRLQGLCGVVPGSRSPEAGPGRGA